MYELTIAGHFSSAHFLRGYQGSCQNLHGHTWKAEVSIAAGELNDLGLVFDFREIKKQLREFLSTLDHTCLNELPAFKSANPSAENLAKYIYQEFAKSCRPFKVTKVRVWESEDASVTYHES